MRLKKLDLANFRSYENLTWNPGPGTNLLVGPNGAGKSNLAEAIYMLATTKSHRTSKDTEVIRIGSDWCRIVGDIEREKQNDVTVEIQLAKGEKTLKINTVKQPKISEVIGQFNVVIFSTWDDADSNCTWVIAAERYMEEDEVEAALNFITENDLQQEYCLMDFLYGRM